jgi:trehalose 6-phosphate synthase/phosphatase
VFSLDDSEYTSHTDGSWIEDKEFAIVWHYARADPEYGKMQATELQKYLIRVIPFFA